MKKYNVFVHIVSNCVIVALLFGLYLACVPSPDTPAYAPIYKGDGNSGKVALMFNVYQGSEYIEGIMEVMEKYDATCTFFVGGCWAEKNMTLLKSMSEKYEIGNHGYLHLDHAAISEQSNREEIGLCGTLIEKVTGKTPTLFAPPSGSIGNAMTKVCAELGYKIIMWSKDTIDWRDKDYELVYKRATSDIQSGDLVLMHPTAHTLKALPTILDYYAANGLSTATVSEILTEEGSY